MTLSQRTNGLVCGALAALLCVAKVIGSMFDKDPWYLLAMVPILGCLWWGILAYWELDQENNRREKILRAHGIDESK
jgi:hypothetical protein